MALKDIWTEDFDIVFVIRFQLISSWKRKKNHSVIETALSWRIPDG